MGPGTQRSATAGFVGRTPELEAIRGVVDAARAGRGGALLLTGEAGVGKTRLVERACGDAPDDVLVLTGAALPLSSLTVPLLPLRAAVRAVPLAERPRLLASPSGGEGGSSDAAMEFGAWLDDQNARRAVVLVVDDLHWADESTLDVLMWVMAGITDRRLAVLATVRRGELSTGHPLQRWLADMRRMPGFAHLALDPLDLTETHDQIAGLLGDEPHDSLVREVYSRTGGNAYLNRLLTAGLDATSTALGEGLPEDLTSAVLRAWHSLPPAARELSRVIAVGGQVAQGPALERAARLAGVDGSTATLRDCVTGGLLEADVQGGYWFHHPLQAEALEASLERPERQRLHAAFATEFEQDLATGSPVSDDESGLETLILIADHHYQAGHLRESYDWGLRAADAAATTAAIAEQLRLLRRALEIRAQLHGAVLPAADLWERLRRAAESLGDHEAELSAVEALLAVREPDHDPLAVAELIVRRQHLRFSTGRGFLDADEIRRAVELAQREPRSWQHAYALAELAHASLWQEDPAAPQVATAALERGRECGDPRGLAYALAANAMLAVVEGRMEEAQGLGAEAVAAATRARDGWAFVHATLWEANALDSPVSPVWSRLVARRREELETLGSPHPYGAWLASVEAGSRLFAGDSEACQRLLRLALGAKPGALVDVVARLTAAHLAALQGRCREAESHLARADELFAETSTFLAFEFDAVRAMVRLCARDLRGAVDAAVAGTGTPGAPPTMCEWLLPLAARALGDLTQHERDRGRDPVDLLDELGDLTQRFPHVIADLGGLTPFYQRELAGLQALYQAEVARSRQAADVRDRWVEAARALHGVLPWEECYALWRQSEALLVAGPAHREAGVEALRRAHSMALGLRAQPILDELVPLARSARVPLTDPATTADTRASATSAGLTGRETEILGHIAAGRTYGEIARALVVSEKTVSSHVSHLLRKTGCANRVDLARWATHSPPDRPT